MIFGGKGADFINGGSGDDAIVGDHGSYSLALFLAGSSPRGITLLEELIGWNDTIFGGDGNDLIYSEGGDDFVDAGAGYDVVYAGSGDDIVYGGADGDTLLGGPGYDFLDGMTGSDSLYVDPFDTWAGGMPEDTIIGGQFFSTNSQLAFGIPALGAAGVSQTNGLLRLGGPSAFTPLPEGTYLEITIGTFVGGGFEGGTQSNFEWTSNILPSNYGKVFAAISYEGIHWEGAGHVYIFVVLRVLGAPPLIGIGDILEMLWSEIMALMDR